MAYGHHHDDDDLGDRELDAPAVRRIVGTVVALLVAAASLGVAAWWPVAIRLVEMRCRDHSGGTLHLRDAARPG
jgi:hypothetical protein